MVNENSFVAFLIHASSVLSCYSLLFDTGKQLLVSSAPAEGNECPVRNTKACLIRTTTVWTSASHLKGSQSTFQDRLKAPLSCRRLGDGSQADNWHILTAEGWGGGNFGQRCECKFLLLPRVIKSVMVNQGRTNRFCAFFFFLIPWENFGCFLPVKYMEKNLNTLKQVKIDIFQRI